MRFAIFAGSLIGLLFATAAVHPARGDGMVYRLPADGTFVKYDLDAKIRFVEGQEIPIAGSLTMSSVGEATVDGEACRWIEFRTVIKIGGQEKPNISKLLIPARHLGSGKSAEGKALRGWVKSGDDEAIEIKDGSAPQLQVENAAFLAGQPKVAGDLKPLEIENGKLGKLKCAGVTGEHDVERVPGNVIHLKFEKRLHDSVPFGVVAALWTFEAKSGEQIDARGTIKLTLTDMGTGAVSELAAPSSRVTSAERETLVRGGGESGPQESPEKLNQLRTAVDKNPDSAEVRRDYGQALQNAGESEQAYEQFAALARLDPQSLLAESKLVQLCEALKKTTERDEHLANVRRISEKTGGTQPWFCREQFTAGEKQVVAFEYFELNGPMAVKYRFEVSGKKGDKSLYRITLGSYDVTTQLSRELGQIKKDERMYHLDSYAGRAHSTYAFIGSRLPSYEQTRKLAVEIIDGKRRPISGSNLPGK
ncbi:MAG: tetratricopeptide repeat protein [Planctomycetia bacterium]|nr:tetratricopeptide repeat protein [Planctomycetia bacterium]